jgi:hypothetical protein
MRRKHARPPTRASSQRNFLSLARFSPCGSIGGRVFGELPGCPCEIATKMRALSLAHPLLFCLSFSIGPLFSRSDNRSTFYDIPPLRSMLANKRELLESYVISMPIQQHWWFSGKIGRCHSRSSDLRCRPAPGSIPGRCIFAGS